MAILDDGSYDDTISWLPSGLGFFIKDRKRFAKEVMPLFFHKKKSDTKTSAATTSTSNDSTDRENVQFSSFTRRLNRWCFNHRRKGKDQSQYFHPHFIRDDHEKCLKIRPKPQVCYKKKSKIKRHHFEKPMENEMIHSRNHLPEICIPRYKYHGNTHEMPHYTNSSHCLPPFAPHGLSMSGGDHIPNQGDVPIGTMIRFPQKMGRSNASIVSQDRKSPLGLHHAYMSAAASNSKLYAVNHNNAPQIFIPPTSMADENMFLSSRSGYSNFPQGTTIGNHDNMMNSTSIPFDLYPQTIHCAQNQPPRHYPGRQNTFVSGLASRDQQQNHYPLMAKAKEQRPMDAPYYSSRVLPPSFQGRYDNRNRHQFNNFEMKIGTALTSREYR